MRIAVCVKQVPVLSRVTFDYETKTIVREGVPLEVNSFDLLAVDRAVELGKQVAGEVVAYTMGPPQARDALVQCLAMGANRAVHLTDRALAGSDTLATARSLSLALKREAQDLILCGRHSTDAETGQVGPELAQLLGLPYVGNARRLDYTSETGSIRVERETDEGHEVIECPLPAVVSVTEGIMPERYPSRQDMLAANDDPSIEDVHAHQLSDDESLFGAAGSPTSVSEIRIIDSQRAGVVIEEDDPKEAARILVEAFGERPPAPPRVQRTAWERYDGGRDRAVWVVGERVASGLRVTTFELLGKARDLADTTRGEVVAVLTGAGPAEEAAELAARGADRVLVLSAPDSMHPAGLACTTAFAGAVRERGPYAVLFPSTANGRDVASRVAATLSLGLTGDCIDLEIDGSGELVQLKPALGGNVVAPILSRTRPYMATLRPGLLSPVAPNGDLEAPVEVIAVQDVPGPDMRVLEVHRQADAGGLALERARVVLGVGMGVGGPEKLPVLQALADRLGAVVAATRNVADAGWLPRQLQVGLTGKAIAPEVYIAVGVRGDFNHMVGIQKAGTILAINNNPNPRRTPILRGADFSIVGDWETYLPPLVDALVPLLRGGTQ